MSRKLGGFHGANHTREARREEKRKAAEKLRAERLKRTPAQQLVILDERLGTGVGAEKERERLKMHLTKPESDV